MQGFLYGEIGWIGSITKNLKIILSSHSRQSPVIHNILDERYDTRILKDHIEQTIQYNKGIIIK